MSLKEQLLWKVSFHLKHKGLVRCFEYVLEQRPVHYIYQCVVCINIRLQKQSRFSLGVDFFNLG